MGISVCLMSNMRAFIGVVSAAVFAKLFHFWRISVDKMVEKSRLKMVEDEIDLKTYGLFQNMTDFEEIA